MGGGGREHAIVEALRRSGAELYAAMANQNPGIRRSAKEVLLGDVTAVDRIAEWAKARGADLAVIGPEAPLAAGIADRLEATGIPTVGPNREAAQLETDKAFTRELMKEHRIPGLPQYWVFDDLGGFEEFVNDSDFEFVIKPLGLTGGKGVRVWGDHFSTKAEALAYGREILERKIAAFVRLLVAAPELAVFDALDEGLSREESARVFGFEAEYRARQPAGTLLYVDIKEA